MTKFLYVVDHYVPFPISEYGGMWIVVAKDGDECFDLIIAEDQNNQNEPYYMDLKENIFSASTFKLSEDIESSIIDSFIT